MNPFPLQKKIFKLLYCLLVLLVSGGTLTAQTGQAVSGRVLNERNEPLTGVTVLVKGTTAGTVTDASGNYELQVPNLGATLVYSYIGFARQEVRIANRSRIDVVLKEEEDRLQELVVVGSRSQNRSVTETPVAIDIIPIQEIIGTSGQLDVNMLLQYVAPSFNVNRQSGSDGSDHVDPATIRGLGPDQTLVLINGKRRHQSSLINIFGTRGRGNTGTDLNTIPAAAIDRVEILRDGASAQYGSDAIAGVINIVLKSSVNEFTGSINTGVTTEGDGENLQLNGNYGFELGQLAGKRGFVNMTMDYLHRNRTNRPADPNVYEVYRRQFGDALSDNFATILNAELPVSEQSSFYAFGGFNFRDTDAYAWTREAGDDRNIPSIYPNGFDPRIQSRITDRSISAGLRSSIKDWAVDLNNTYGANRFHYLVDGTLNASLLDESPTRFDAGGFELAQNTTSINLSRYFQDFLAGTNIAFGTEYRLERYQIFAGEEASWRNYGIIDTVIDGRLQQYDRLGRAGGSQGFPGFNPDNELDEYRTNIGVYVDGEFDFSRKFMIAAAARFEHYSDFGRTLNGKLATRLALTEAFALRGSLSTGFRAPSLAQIYFNSTFTDFVGGVAVDKVIAGNTSSITRKLGIPALKEERALNASLGFTATLGNFTATVDGYYVDIDDRIVLTGAFEDTDDVIGPDLQALNVGAAQFFTNAVDTRTRGLDVILNYNQRFGTDNRLNLSLAGNFNDMEITGINTTQRLQSKEDIYFGRREQLFLIASAPPSKINLIADYRFSGWNINAKLMRFGEIVLEDWDGEDDVYEANYTTDLAIARSFGDHLSLTLGGINIFDVYPTRQDPVATESGGLWDPVQMGFTGRFLYARLRLSL
ncbi:TonB-dependent receptor [Cesiribacter andamanensis]|uniref:Enterobactin outer-membrane receptor n=1 Tax=Cesiribacter andamanensis AMV16 TaxID=1279009 RepID=M7N5M6_9BACT|nr:TonB-dependent receptor [Cesiribacter andamanensis]EMR02592.1 Enterobactin outer-membrane receptor [Cesiribacter andamanensis AMV16]